MGFREHAIHAELEEVYDVNARIETTGELIEWLKKKDKTGKRKVLTSMDGIEIIRPRRDGGYWIVASCEFES